MIKVKTEPEDFFDSVFSLLFIYLSNWRIPCGAALA